MRVYLCGPINGCTDAECKDWRAHAKSHLKYTSDPMDRDYRGIEYTSTAEIVEGDKSDIDNCHVLLVNYVQPSVGTSMEILYGWERGKQIVVVAAKDAPLSPWLRYHSHYITDSFNHAFALIHGMR